MNAAIALCHFCEAHGPCAIFCTQTLRDTKLEELNLDNQQIPNKMCLACNSLGKTNAIYSRDNESGATFLSTQIPILPEVANLIKQASVRSLSCEINFHKDGGFVFFGDSSRGHVLSHTFHVGDLQARGFYQLFSIIILMKDKYFLLNIKPFLAEHLQKISTEIQTSAQKIKCEEAAKGSPRQRRLSSSQLMVQTPRSLVELTGEKNIYAILHSHFSWILLAGSRFLTEHVTFGNLPWLPPAPSVTCSLRQLTILPHKAEDDPPEEDQEEFISLRFVKQLLRNDLAAACFCVLTGIKIIVRGSPAKSFNFMMCLRKLLPEQMHNVMQIDAQQFLTNSECRIVSVSPDVAVPIASSATFRIDFLDNENDKVSVKWPGEMPNKWPDLLQKIIKAVDEERFTHLVLNKQTRVLVEEWKNKVICLNRARSSSGLTKLKKVLGVQSQDQPIINYWSPHLQGN